jgi:hypothetical protein
MLFHNIFSALRDHDQVKNGLAYFQARLDKPQAVMSRRVCREAAQILRRTLTPTIRQGAGLRWLLALGYQMRRRPRIRPSLAPAWCPVSRRGRNSSRRPEV